MSLALVEDPQLFLLVKDERIGRNAVRQKDVRANRAVRADDCFGTHYGRACVDRYVILDGGMTTDASQALPS